MIRFRGDNIAPYFYKILDIIFDNGIIILIQQIGFFTMAKQFIKNLVPFSINGIFPKSSLDGAYTLSSLTFNNQVIEKPFVSSINAYFSVTGDSLNIKLVWLSVNKNIEDYKEGGLGNITVSFDRLSRILGNGSSNAQLKQFFEHFQDTRSNPKWVVAFTEKYNQKHSEQIYGLGNGLKVSFVNCSKDTKIDLDDVLVNILEQLAITNSFEPIAC